MNAFRTLTRLRGQGGYVTAETALVLPTLVGLGLALAFVVTAAGEQIRCADAAWEAARGLARGEPAAQAAETVRRLAPAGAAFSVTELGGTVAVRVTAGLAFGRTLLPVLRIEGRASVACEPAVPCSAGPADSADPAK